MNQKNNVLTLAGLLLLSCTAFAQFNPGNYHALAEQHTRDAQQKIAEKIRPNTITYVYQHRGWVVTGYNTDRSEKGYYSNNVEDSFECPVSDYKLLPNGKRTWAVSTQCFDEGNQKMHQKYKHASSNLRFYQWSLTIPAENRCFAIQKGKVSLTWSKSEDGKSYLYRM